MKRKALDQPCARIAARHDGGAAAKKVAADEAGGLESNLVLSRHAKVMITRNLWQEHGACRLFFCNLPLTRI